MDYTIHPIAYIRSDFTDKFGIPRQSGLVPELTARIVFAPEYRDPNALTGIEGYDRLWLIWQFSTVAAEYAAGKNEGKKPRILVTAASGRQRAARRLCHPQPLPAECAGPVLCGAGRCGKRGSDRPRRRPFGRYADL